jgi:hypothetical protein
MSNPFNQPQGQRLSRDEREIILVPDKDGTFVPIEQSRTFERTDPEGNPEKVSQHCIVVDAGGKVITQNPLGYYCRSWQGYMVRHEDHGVCAMCQFEFLRKRYVFLLVDGGVTDLGNCLCAECLVINEQRKKRYKRWFGLKKEVVF